MTPEEMGVNFKGEKQEYHGFQAKCVDLLRDQVIILSADLQKHRVNLEQTNLQNDENLRLMNDLHSLLSLIRHRHMPRGLDLEKDIDKALGLSSVALREWWAKQLESHAPGFAGLPEKEHGFAGTPEKDQPRGGHLS